MSWLRRVLSLTTQHSCSPLQPRDCRSAVVSLAFVKRTGMFVKNLIQKSQVKMGNMKYVYSSLFPREKRFVGDVVEVTNDNIQTQNPKTVPPHDDMCLVWASLVIESTVAGHPIARPSFIRKVCVLAADIRSDQSSSHCLLSSSTHWVSPIFSTCVGAWDGFRRFQRRCLAIVAPV